MNAMSRKTLRRAAAIGALVLAGGMAAGVLASPHGGAGMMPLYGHGLQRMLDGVDATAEQRSQIEQIAEAARNDLKAQSDAAGDLRAQAMALFTQPTVDAAAAEQLRQQMLARHEQGSQRMMQAMLEISRVLTVEQRQQIAERMQQRGERMHRHMKERQQPGATR